MVINCKAFSNGIKKLIKDVIKMAVHINFKNILLILIQLKLFVSAYGNSAKS